jgi:phytoene desaturase
MDRLSANTRLPIRDAVVFKRSYAHRDFMADYHSYKGNACLANNAHPGKPPFQPTLKSKKSR